MLEPAPYFSLSDTEAQHRPMLNHCARLQVASDVFTWWNTWTYQGW
jgi:hypothetical protein